jgi:hypothetical protein
MAQAECITTAIRELMSRGQPPKSTNPVRLAHTEFVAALAGNAPHSIYADADSEDLEDRADHLERLFAALHVYLTAAKFMLPWSFSEEVAAQKYMPQLQHNMWVINAKAAALSIITGGGKWVEIAIPADPLYQHLLLTAEKKFWRCVENGEPPRLFGLEPPRPRIEAVRIVDMSASNAWAEFSGVFRRTRQAYLEHENAKTELKALMPEDAKEAVGHGIRAKRSKSGAVSFDVLSMEGSHAPLQ